MAAEGEDGVVGKAFEVADGEKQFGLSGAEMFDMVGFQLFGQDEVAVEVEVGFEDRKVVDAPFQGAGVDVALYAEGFGHEVDVVGCAVARNEDYRACEGLATAPFFGYLVIGTGFGVTTFVHHVHYDGLRDEQQHADDEDETEFQSEFHSGTHSVAFQDVLGIDVFHVCCVFCCYYVVCFELRCLFERTLNYKVYRVKKIMWWRF